MFFTYKIFKVLYIKVLYFQALLARVARFAIYFLDIANRMYSASNKFQGEIKFIVKMAVS